MNQVSTMQDYVLPLPLDDVNAVELLSRYNLVVDLIHINIAPTCPSVDALLKLWWPRLRAGGVLVANGHRIDKWRFMRVKHAFEVLADESSTSVDCTDQEIRIGKPIDAPKIGSRPTVALDDVQPPTDVLDYDGEFSSELLLFLPYVTWLSKAGLLRKRRVTMYRGMRCFYDDLDCQELVEKFDARRYVAPENRLSCLPVKDESTYHIAHRSAFHFFPDLRSKFKTLPIAPLFERLSKPLLVIHNKYNIEWGGLPVNQIDLECLDTIFGTLKQHFTIVYIRHGMTPEPKGYSKDDNYALPFDDRALLREHPSVICFDDAFAEYVAASGKQDINTFKNVLYSRCHRFISSQGGGAAHIAFYSGSLIVVLHRAGDEADLAYGDGYYSFVANPSPIRAICRNDDELLRSLELFRDSAVVGERIVVPGSHEMLLNELSPATLFERSQEDSPRKQTTT